MMITVRVRAGAAQTKLVWVSESEVRIWVTTPPEKGKANKHVQTLLAKDLKVTPSDLVLLKGHTSSIKLFQKKNHS
jgi:uncharacterized protein (TIGR00251 family)